MIIALALYVLLFMIGSGSVLFDSIKKKDWGSGILYAAFLTWGSYLIIAILKGEIAYA